MHKSKSDSTMELSFLTPVVWCVLITETVERFAYFGFRAVLVLYFINSLEYGEETAIALYAYVTCLAYASPMLGAILADAHLGRYKTILWFGWMYAVGLAILTAGAFVEDDLQMQRILSFSGLFLVCMGTGGIKPCVSAFGADQVAAMDRDRVDDNGTEDDSPASSESEQVRAFFASFYFCINLGAVTSISIIPIVKHHYGYGAAFLLPSIFIVLAMFTFLSKRKEYVHHVPGQDGTSLSATFALSIFLMRNDLARHAWVARLCPCITPKRSPIGAEDDSSSNQQLSDAKQALQVLPIMSMFPIFWMLYDQQSSVWTLQATRMKLHGLQAEQLIIVNPVEIMVFIPLFDRVIYPFMESRLGMNISHLRRMRWGMLLTAIAFSASGLLESWIQHSADNSVSVFWQLPQITILAVAEIFVSVTGLEFAYSTSPVRLKAFIMGLYLLTTAVGDFFGGLLYSSIFQQLNRATVMHVCAGLMLLNLAAFCWVGIGWERRKEEEDADKDLELSALRSLSRKQPKPMF
jgi:POT family proton-dependent oligopeptide transporter